MKSSKIQQPNVSFLDTNPFTYVNATPSTPVPVSTLTSMGPPMGPPPRPQPVVPVLATMNLGVSSSATKTPYNTANNANNTNDNNNTSTKIPNGSAVCVGASSIISPREKGNGGNIQKKIENITQMNNSLAAMNNMTQALSNNMTGTGGTSGGGVPNGGGGAQRMGNIKAAPTVTFQNVGNENVRNGK